MCCSGVYLDCSQGRRLPVHWRLLLSLRDELAGDISAASVPCWITSMVAAAYTVSPSHEMQAIAALVAFQNATPIVDILEVAY